MSMRAPVLFIGHGSPMNAISNNAFTQSLLRAAQEMPRPRAILCISAHWLTEGTFVTGAEKPKIIHDMYGFPDELMKLNYPAKGDPILASLISNTFLNPRVLIDEDEWGIDHGAWAVLKHMYPDADIPVLQLSIDSTRSASFHYQLGEKLQMLRDLNILILGSGNVVHNLRRMQYEEKAPPDFWAVEFNEWVKEKLVEGDFQSLVNEFSVKSEGKLSVPTTEHYFPMLYVLGASTKKDQFKILFDEIHHATISMLSFGFYPS